jgi:hypothetical protein
MVEIEGYNPCTHLIPWTACPVGSERRLVVNKNMVNSQRAMSIAFFYLFKNYFYYHVIVVLGVHCDISKSAYNIS